MQQFTLRDLAIIHWLQALFDSSMGSTNGRMCSNPEDITDTCNANLTLFEKTYVSFPEYNEPSLHSDSPVSTTTTPPSSMTC
ncbi:hypothetical protein VTP01DRAFT_523 [Rhizomucor pusillus]|uniref:uncharacterized protein n=1 Tax=Rhizomucor pusillus TaxID=4840 RepID=UPI003743E040